MFTFDQSSTISMLHLRDSGTVQKAMVAIKEAAMNKQQATTLAQTEGLIEGLVNLIKNPISPQATKASLVTAYYLASSSEQVISRFVDTGLVQVLVEVIFDSEKSVCEKALGVLDRLLDSEKGREMACANALAMPVLIKKMFRVSDLATEFAVSAVWKLLCNKCGRDEEKARRLGESALSVGGFQKLLLLLQLGSCSERTREKASDLLRMMNAWRVLNGECIESADFKGLKRSF